MKNMVTNVVVIADADVAKKVEDVLEGLVVGWEREDRDYVYFETVVYGEKKWVEVTDGLYEIEEEYELEMSDLKDALKEFGDAVEIDWDGEYGLMEE